MSKDTVKDGEDKPATREEIAALMEEIRAANPPTQDPEKLGRDHRTNLGRRRDDLSEAEGLDERMSMHPGSAVGAQHSELSIGRAEKSVGGRWGKLVTRQSEPNPDDKGQGR